MANPGNFSVCLQLDATAPYLLVPGGSFAGLFVSIMRDDLFFSQLFFSVYFFETVFGAPSDLTITHTLCCQLYQSPVFTVGALSPTSINPGDKFSLSILPGPTSSALQIQNGTLVYTYSPQVGSQLSVTICVANLAGLTLNVTFVVTNR